MVKYINKKFDCYLSDKKLNENILKENPLSKNTDPVKILDQ